MIRRNDTLSELDAGEPCASAEGQECSRTVFCEREHIGVGSRRMAAISSVAQFPRWIQITFGGGPSRKLRWWKSASFETIAKPWRAAYSQTESSPAVWRPSFLTWVEPL